ncbi:hypothetical protein ACPWR0_17455 [Pandoraea pneumonica]|uniref:hypothetical protein n=1 Tax=Pandoraea pneumonica TaxID=2508299 RepID=UPI003CE94055
MQQDRRHQKRRSDRKTQRDSARGNARRVVATTLLEASRSALRRLAQATRSRRAAGGRARIRGAALLEIVLTVAALATGAQGFAYWQSFDGVSLTRPLIANDVQSDGRLT